MKLSIIIPSIDGRSHWLARALKAFKKTTPVSYETIIVMNKPTCGIAWNEGIKKSSGDYILLAADDLEPLPGWYEAGTECIDRGFLPAARILNTDGSLQSCGDDSSEQPNGTPTELARIPFCSHEQMEKIYPIIRTHYFTDSWVSHRGRINGWHTIVVRDMLFYHHFAPEGRVDERLYDDLKKFRRAQLRDGIGKSQWYENSPWIDPV